MSELVNRFRNDLAPRLLGKFSNGGVAVVVRVVAPNPDPLQPPSVSETSSPIDAFAKGVSAQMVAADPNLVATDLRVLFAAVQYSPAVGDVVSVSGSDRRVIRVDAIPANGPPAIYWAFVR